MKKRSERDHGTETFLAFHYPELKDLGKHFLTIASAAAVFLVTFYDKIESRSCQGKYLSLVGPKTSMLVLLLAIVAAGSGLLVNYIAGAGASGGIIWGRGRNYRFLTGFTYVLYLVAGSSLVMAFLILGITVICR